MAVFVSSDMCGVFPVQVLVATVPNHACAFGVSSLFRVSGFVLFPGCLGTHARLPRLLVKLVGRRVLSTVTKSFYAMLRLLFAIVMPHARKQPTNSNGYRGWKKRGREKLGMGECQRQHNPRGAQAVMDDVERCEGQGRTAPTVTKKNRACVLCGSRSRNDAYASIAWTIAAAPLQSQTACGHPFLLGLRCCF